MFITIIHPDLGIGGAERLVVDAAIAMKQNGHRVQFVTNHFNPKHSFLETKEFDIKVVDVFPRSIFGFGHALCAYIRMCIAALYICIFLKRTELVFSDSISSCLLIFRVFRLLGLFNAPVIFYCHFPDQLLTTRESMMKKFYRVFVDWFETWTTAMADLICVNSEFTRKTVSETFPCIHAQSIRVLYPTLNTKFFDSDEITELNEIPNKARHIFVSINRYERKKNIGLALEAFSLLREKIPEDDYQDCFLVIAGGYDTMNDENIAHFVELQKNAIALGLSKEQYIFLKSPTDMEKLELLRRATAVLYTPTNEHFGIVPVEAMYMKCCVIASNSGGPCETIINDETGFLEEKKMTLAGSKAFIGQPAPNFKTTAVVNGDFKEISLGQFKGKYVVLFFYPLDFTFVCPTEIIAFSDRIAEFKQLDVAVMACSTDSHFSHLAWVNTDRKMGGLGQMNIPILADTNHVISRAYGVLKEDDGIAYRGLFIIDPKGILRQITINDLPVGRSVDETLRLIQAFQFVDKHGEVCPANWHPGSETIKPGVKESKAYFEKH